MSSGVLDGLDTTSYFDPFEPDPLDVQSAAPAEPFAAPADPFETWSTTELRLPAAGGPPHVHGAFHRYLAGRLRFSEGEVLYSRQPSTQPAEPERPLSRDERDRLARALEAETRRGGPFGAAIAGVIEHVRGGA